LVRVGTATYGGSDYKLIYDVEDELTWLDYSNSGATYPASLAWAASLEAALTINLDAGYSNASWAGTDWRLPAAFGYWSNNSSNNVSSSEIEGLYYDELGNELNDASLNFGDFDNIESNYHYIEAMFPISISYAPYFNFDNGTDGFVTSSVNGGIYAMAVRSGAVPEPGTMAIVAIGAAGLVRRRGFFHRG
jgi:hypothetical protein